MGEISSIRVLFVRKAENMYKIIFVRDVMYSIEQELIIKEKDLLKTLSLLISNNYVIGKVKILNESENKHE